MPLKRKTARAGFRAGGFSCPIWAIRNDLSKARSRLRASAPTARP
ncbi:hypothetical protein USDA257_c47160 [Sinorhizobium fredii USDA 257]|uniref:Uncharacterized protein n=1 Tax=Sinorhizobium fredii (strain USDA 257) TaxID=1185652 RepID=I3XBJ6_SINF2|nr:hypothetical protein USDA257_c47160 [Sinorhizobium fredii USDA 257]